jgi:hypothetical protein
VVSFVGAGQGEDGQISELGELIADDNAIDLDQWLDDRTWLEGCSTRLIEIAHKRLEGIILTPSDKMYLQRYREREQTKLF